MERTLTSRDELILTGSLHIIHEGRGTARFFLIFAYFCKLWGEKKAHIFFFFKTCCCGQAFASTTTLKAMKYLRACVECLHQADSEEQ